MSALIDYGTAIQLLCAAHSCIEESVEKLVFEWGSECPPPTIAMATAGRALVSHAQECSADDLKRVFGLVEELLVSGDDTVRDATATGLLEAIIGRSCAESVNVQSIVRYLGARSRAYCREWDRFTGVATPGLNDAQ